MLNENEVTWDDETPKSESGIDVKSVSWDDEKPFYERAFDKLDDVKDTEIGWLKDAGHGASKAIDEYGASINKGLDKVLPDAVSEYVGLKDNQKFWNDRKEMHSKAIDNEWAGLAGEIIGDPINATPAGIITKGTKLARVAKSMAAGSGVGAGTMAFKNYGDDSKTDEQKLEEIGISAGFVSVLNGVIAGVTKGKVKNFVDATPEEKSQAIAKISEEDEALGAKLNEVYSSEPKPASVIDEADVKWDDSEEFMPSRFDQAEPMKSFNEPVNNIDAKKSPEDTFKKIDDGASKSIEDMPLLQNKEGWRKGAIDLEVKYLKDNKINMPSIEAEAKPFMSPLNPREFAESFGGKGKAIIQTPIGEASINVKSQYYKLKNWKEDRTNLSGVIKDTLENPLFIVRHNDAKKYYAPYKGDDGVTHIISITEDKNGVDILKSNYEPFSEAKIKELIKVPEEDLLYMRGNTSSTQSLPTVRTQDGQKSIVSNESITQQLAEKQGWRKGNASQDTLIHAGKSAVGAGVGATYGSNADLNGDGKIDGTDTAIGAALGLGVRYAPKALSLAEKGANKAIKGAANNLIVKPVKALDRATGSKLSSLSESIKQNEIVDFVVGQKIYKKLGYMRYRTRMYETLSKNMQQHEIMYKQLSQLSVDARESMYKYMSGDKTAALTPELKKFADNTISSIDAKGRQLVDLGVLEEAQFEKFKGMYLHRTYTKDYKAGMSMLGSKGNTITGVHSRGHQWTGTKKEYEEIVKSGKIGKFEEGGIEVTKMKNGKYQFSQDWTPEQRAKWGEVQDASYAIPETLSRLDDMITNATFLKNVAGSSKYISDVPAEGFTQLTGKRYGMLQGKYVPNDIAHDVGAMADNMFGLAQDARAKKIREAATKYLSLWKASHTIWNPKAHVNNLMSNVTMQAMEGIPVATSMKNAVIGSRAYQKVNRINDLKALELKGLTAEESNELATLLSDDSAKLYMKAQETGLFGRSQLNDILNDFMMKRSQHGQKENSAIFRAKDKIEQYAEQAYQAEDNVMRFALLKSLTDQGMDFKKAITRVNNTIPDYTKPMSEAARLARNTGVVPFMSWTYYSMPILLRQMKENPAKAITIIGGMTAVYQSFGIDPFSEEELPKSFSYRRVPIYQDGDEITTLKVDKWFPHAGLANPVEFIRGFANAGAWQPTLDAIQNKDSFTQRKINNSEDWHGKLDLAQFVSKNVLPSPDVADQIFSLIGSKVFDEEKRRNNKVITPRSTKQELINIGGLNNLTYDKKQQLKKYRAETIRRKKKER